MNRKRMGIASVACVLAMLVTGLWVVSGLPADAQLAIHWNARGEADGFANKWTAVLLTPLIAVGVALLFWYLPKLEPREKGLMRSQGLYSVGWGGTLLILAIAQFSILATAVGYAIDVARLIVAGLGILFLLMGNQLAKSRSMYLVGIRTPWTLDSEDVWIKTHRLGGRLMAASGVIFLVLALTGLGADRQIAAILLLTLGTAIVPTVYSYFLWRHERDRQPRR